MLRKGREEAGWEGMEPQKQTRFQYDWEKWEGAEGAGILAWKPIRILTMSGREEGRKSFEEKRWAQQGPWRHSGGHSTFGQEAEEVMGAQIGKSSGQLQLGFILWAPGVQGELWSWASLLCSSWSSWTTGVSLWAGCIHAAVWSESATLLPVPAGRRHQSKTDVAKKIKQR